MDQVAATDARDVAGFLEAATALEQDLPRPGAGRAALLWEALAASRPATCIARAVKPHLDALAIPRRGRHRPRRPDAWGVYAAEGPRRLRAATERRLGAAQRGGSWCSLGGR